MSRPAFENGEGGRVNRRSARKSRHNHSMGQFDQGPLVAQHVGIQRREPPSDLNETERLVHRILDDELVTAREIAGFAGLTVEQCRRALATLRAVGMAELERPRRKNATSLWRRA